MTKRRCGANAKYSKVWVPYVEAIRASVDNGMEGVGFVVPKGYIAFDFGHCVQNNPMLKRAHELLPSYTEKSPSGRGEHIICMVDASKLPQRDGKWDPDYYIKKALFMVGDGDTGKSTIPIFYKNKIEKRLQKCYNICNRF